jgi:hypothetical protein
LRTTARTARARPVMAGTLLGSAWRAERRSSPLSRG